VQCCDLAGQEAILTVIVPTHLQVTADEDRPEHVHWWGEVLHWQGGTPGGESLDTPQRTPGCRGRTSEWANPEIPKNPDNTTSGGWEPGEVPGVLTWI